jgi:hypothetical protein
MAEIDTKPPKGAREAAERGLELRREHGRGGTLVGVARARDISDGDSLSRETIGRMVSFFARHEGNDRSDKTGAAYISWLLWGGDAGKRWAERKLAEFEAKTSDVAAMAGISAAEREIVETVRVHILPMERTEFICEDGSALTVGGPDLVPSYFESIAADMEARGRTFVPVLVEHGGPAVGMVREVVLEADGIYLIKDLWAEGVEARYGRDFVSAYWRFGELGEDGRPTAARIVECSFTPTPQFSLAQTPVSELETIADGLFPIAATMAAPFPTPESPEMTPEEMIEALAASEAFGELVASHVAKAMEAAEEVAEEADEEEAAEAMMGENDEEEMTMTVDAEAGHYEDESSEVAASLARLDDINDRLARLEKAQNVKASLRGRKTSTPTPESVVPAEFGARVLHYRKQGYDRASAVKAAQNHGA